MSPGQVIVKEYEGGVNFMTPNIEEVGWVIENKIAYEISYGNSMSPGIRLWGVCFVRLYADGSTKRLTEHCLGSRSLSDIRDRIQSVKEATK